MAAHHGCVHLFPCDGCGSWFPVDMASAARPGPRIRGVKGCYARLYRRRQADSRNFHHQRPPAPTSTTNTNIPYHPSSASMSPISCCTRPLHPPIPPSHQPTHARLLSNLSQHRVPRLPATLESPGQPPIFGRRWSCDCTWPEGWCDWTTAANMSG